VSFAERHVQLGNTDLKIAPLGLGAWAWGDRLYWGYGGSYQEQDINDAFTISLSKGINFIDTAEVYGMGRSEKYLGKFIHERASETPPYRPVVATKFFPFPWRLTRSSLARALRASLRRLGLEQIDLYQLHSPYSLMPIETLANALADVVQAGLARAVGISNFNAAQTQRAHDALAKRQVSLASNQLPYSLLNRRIETDGTLQVCQELNITVLSYSPLAQGVLTGKYTPKNPPKGLRGRIYTSRLLSKVQSLIRLMQDIGQAHQGKTPAQVALNWAICKGTLPIPGAKNSRQAVENVGDLGWRLSPGEIELLDHASTEVHS